MCWTPLCTSHKTKTNKIENATQYLLDTPIHKSQDEDKQNRKCNTIFVGHPHLQVTDEDKQNRKCNTIFVGHHHTQDTRRRQTKQKTQHNICWTPPYTRHKTKTNKIKCTTQYVLDTKA